MKKLSAVIEETSYSLFFNRDFYTEEAILNMNIEDLSYNSKKARGGVIFFCLVGAKADGHSFAHEAYRAGVKIFVCERVLSRRRRSTDSRSEFQNSPCRNVRFVFRSSGKET